MPSVDADDEVAAADEDVEVEVAETVAGVDVGRRVAVSDEDSVSVSELVVDSVAEAVAELWPVCEVVSDAVGSDSVAD